MASQDRVLTLMSYVMLLFIRESGILRYYQIFDIEDEMEQAVATEDDTDRIPLEPSNRNGLERRASRKSSRPSTRSLRPTRPPSPKEHEPDHIPQHAPPSQPSPPRNISHQRQVSAPISLRRRLTPSIHKPDVAQSPLAQVYQPVLLDDVPTTEDAVWDTPSSGSALLLQPQLGYGPATRRRLASMQSMHKRPSEALLLAPVARPVGLGRPPYPPLDTRTETLMGPSSLSSDLQVTGREREMMTAEQVEEALEENGGMSEWMKRMERMEERQERIEGLLVQLHAQLQR